MPISLFISLIYTNQEKENWEQYEIEAAYEEDECSDDQVGYVEDPGPLEDSDHEKDVRNKPEQCKDDCRCSRILGDTYERVFSD